MRANAEHRLGCVSGWAQKRRRPFSPRLPQFQSFQHSPASALQRHDSSLSTDAPFYALLVVAVINPQNPGRAQLLPSGEAGKCTLLGLILRPEVELQLELELDTSVSVCAPVGRAPFGRTRTLVCLDSKASQSHSR